MANHQAKTLLSEQIQEVYVKREVFQNIMP